MVTPVTTVKNAICYQITYSGLLAKDSMCQNTACNRLADLVGSTCQLKPDIQVQKQIYYPDLRMLEYFLWALCKAASAASSAVHAPGTDMECRFEEAT